MKARASLVALVAVLAACDGGPKAGEVVFDLASPNTVDGAVQFTVQSVLPATLDSVTAACVGCQVFSEGVSETEIRGVVLGQVVPGPALRVMVSDREARTYTAAVIAASDPSYALRRTTGYTLTPQK